MKRALKIGLITVGSLVSFVAVVVSLICWLVFTPARLTGIVNKVADRYLTCETSVGEIDLTFIGTFPKVSLQLSDVVLINPIDGAASDTVAVMQHCSAVLDFNALIKNNAVVLHRLQLDGGKANLYTNANGMANYMVFPVDTLAKEEPADTMAFDMPDIDIKEIDIRNIHVDYRDDVVGQKSTIEELTMHMNGRMQGNQLQAELKTSLRKVAVAMEGENVMNACVENLRLDMDGALCGSDVEVDINFKAGSVDALTTDLEARMKQVEWIFKGWGADGQWGGSTMLNAQPIETEMKGENPVNVILAGLNLNADAKLNGKEITLTPTLTLPGLSVDLGGERMLDNSNIRVRGALQLDTLFSHVTLTDGLFALNEQEITLCGEMEMPDTSTINAYVNFETNHWDISHMLALVPRCYFHLLEGIDVSGGVALKGKGNGSLVEGGARIENLDAALTLDNIDLLYNDSIALQSHKSYMNMVYDGRKDHMTGHLLSDRLEVSMTGLADAQLCEMEGDFIVSQTMRMADGYVDAEAHISMEQFASTMDTLELYTQDAAMNIALNGSKGKKPQFNAALHVDTMHTAMGALLDASTGEFSIKAQAVYDESANDILSQWNPQLAFDVHTGDVSSTMLTVPVAIPHIRFDYADGRFTINDSRILLGNSDFGLRGDVHNIDSFISKTGLLKAELDFSSAYTDVTQLMDLVSGLGSTDTQEAVGEIEEEDIVEDEPFMVPLGVDVKLNTDIRTVNVNGFKFDDIGGDVSVKDGVLVLEEMGFTSDAARMQLTAMYKSPRKNHLFVGFDFHLLDIEIDELIHMVPDVDSIIPMLSAFDGEAEFHFAAETYLKSNYDIKMSTLRAAGAIEGKDLVVMDNETFEQISKFFFDKETKNVVDSVSVELTVFKDEVDLYPFLIAMDDYKAVVGGRHNINEDFDFNYHISLTSPIRLGLDINGSLDDIKLKPVACKYAHMYNPKKQNAVQARTLQLKKLISDSLKDNVKPQASRAQE